MSSRKMKLFLLSNEYKRQITVMSGWNGFICEEMTLLQFCVIFIRMKKMAIMNMFYTLYI
jgi:hypothetical protein